MCRLLILLIALSCCCKANLLINRDSHDDEKNTIVMETNRKRPRKGNEWDYGGDIGPDHWYKTYPQCAGDNQSPVSIDTTLVVYDEALKGLQLDGYNSVSAVNMSLTNNGHTVQVDLQGQSLTIQGGALPGVYKAAQFHFHWGAENKRGSEHNLDDQNFPMEMHIVHYKDDYANIKEAMVNDKGLMVLGFFFKVGRHNRHFDDILGHFNEITHKDDHVNIPTIPLRKLMANNLDLYYRYRGSLTTPPCYESVIWTVFREPIEISQFQVEQFRNKVKKNYPDEPDLDLTDDFRPVQPLNHRIIYGSHIDTLMPYRSHGENGAGHAQLPFYLLLLSVCISLFV
ncbi:carbonic anhydrase 2-like isoform X2 [Mizuhopecten yessoensis]|uniref:carbonic anhydrase 2-like isoform X2 n=1 Tax=Mizuhopecten yessoensis TaxID=6573 RepID=UPI000B4590AE|nr:carbonic anhydrase 2-like isoform X2 [Mizuhopecten yessoensis]